MAQADSAHITRASSLSPGGGCAHRNGGVMSAATSIYLTPLGYSSHRPAVDMPPIDRRALMQAAHAIARKAASVRTCWRARSAFSFRWSRSPVA